MPLKLNISDGFISAALSGEIDHHSAKALRDEIDSAIIRVQPQLLDLDFSAVSFMDSSGIGLIMGRCRLMDEHGGSVRICGASGHLKKVLKLSGIDRIATVETAKNKEAPNETAE